MTRPSRSTVVVSILGVIISLWIAVPQVRFAMNYGAYETTDFQLVDSRLELVFSDSYGREHSINKELEYTRHKDRARDADTLTVLYDSRTGRSTVLEIFGKPAPVMPLVFVGIALFLAVVTGVRLLRSTNT